MRRPYAGAAVIGLLVTGSFSLAVIFLVLLIPQIAYSLSARPVDAIG
jgi:hypothetical protein